MIDYKIVNKKISPFKFLVHDEETQSVRGSLIILMENTDRKYSTLGKMRDSKEMDTIGHLLL